MRVFVAGASGVIGRHLVPVLVEAGHEVAGMTRSAVGAEVIQAAGARAVVGNVFDRPALAAAVAAFAPDVVVHELSDLPDEAAALRELAEANNRIRREGTRNLLDAAAAAGSRRFVAQSVAWQLPGEGGAAAAALEEAVLGAGGVVLRYGRFYGPGTYYEVHPPPPPRIRVEEAARRTAQLLEAPSGIVVIEEAVP